MKTDDLITRLTHDEAAPRRLPAWPLVFALAIAATAGMFVAILGWRTDVAAAAATPRFLFKVLLMLALAAICLAGLPKLTRPTETGRIGLIMALPPALILLAVVAELVVLPFYAWPSSALGSNALICLSCIPVLSLASLALFIAALRQGAPSRPVASGALAGLAAGGVGAAFYALHCPDDSPLFVAIWYSLALAGVSGLGALAGHRWLRW
jgi:hypothetical protein